MNKPIRIRFWQFVHDTVERFWHWIWRVKLNPYYEAHKMPSLSRQYIKVFENEEVTIYRTN
jgi:hypothetical protein